jgi:outer membrane receptor for ferrienterochelin and colicins
MTLVLAAILTAALGTEAAPDAAAATAECRLSGVVHDGSGLPVAGGDVVLSPGPAVAATDRRGRYCFAALDDGRYEATASGVTASGLARAGSAVELSGSPVHVDFVLVPVPFEETVVVTATRTQRRLEEVPVRTEVVSRETIERTAARTLADAIEYTTGVRVENNCQNCNFQQIRLLGLDGAYSQILVDGQPLVSSLAQVYGVEHIPAQMIERIEVVKGGGSAVYGPGSVAGVVNVIPRVPSHSGGFLEARGESMDGEPARSLGAALDWVPRERTQLGAVAQIDRVDPVDLTADGFTDVSRRRFEAFGLRLGQELFGGAGRLRLDAGRVHEDRRGGDSLDLPESEAMTAESVDSTRDHAGASFWHRPSAQLDYRLTASFVHTARDTYYGSGMDENAYGFSENPLWVLDGQVNRYARRRILSAGVQWTSDHLEDAQPAYERFTDDTYRNLGAYVQDDWAIARGVQLLYGVRADKHNALEDVVVSPRVALRLTPRPEWGLRASVARGFRAPQVFDEDLHITQVGGEGQVIRNAPGLREESSLNLVLSGEWTPSFRTGNALVEVSLFQTRISDLFNVQEAEDPDLPGAEFERVNGGAARVYGVEMNVGLRLGSRAQIEAGWVEQRSRFDDPEPDFGSEDFFRTPDRYGIASLTLRNPRLADLFVGARYTGPMKVPHYAGHVPEDRLETTPSFLVLDANLSRTLTLAGSSRLTLGVGVRNLTNAFQEDLDDGPDRDSGYVYGPRYPRSLFVTARVGF